MPAHTIWSNVTIPNHRPLTHDVDAEVCIVGAGIAGVATAYELARAGIRAVVIERDLIGTGETSRSTSHLTAALDDGFTTIIQRHGEDHARTAAVSHTAAIDRMEMIASVETIECEFERIPGYLFAEDPASDDDRQTIDDELSATHTVGLSTSRLDRLPIHDVALSPALHHPRQAQCHPIKYLNGLVAATERHGGMFYCRTGAAAIASGDTMLITTDAGYRISANHVVMATNTTHGTLDAKLQLYRSYVMGFRTPRGSIPRFLGWDTGTPYHYIRIVAGIGDEDDVLLIGGEDERHDQGFDPPRRFARLEHWCRQKFPMAGEIVTQWWGNVHDPADALAYLGRDPAGDGRSWVITGDCCNGMTNATIGAMIIRDGILGRENAWAECYDPGRER